MACFLVLIFASICSSFSSWTAVLTEDYLTPSFLIQIPQRIFKLFRFGESTYVCQCTTLSPSSKQTILKAGCCCLSLCWQPVSQSDESVGFSNTLFHSWICYPMKCVTWLLNLHLSMMSDSLHTQPKWCLCGCAGWLLLPIIVGGAGKIANSRRFIGRSKISKTCRRALSFR